MAARPALVPESGPYEILQGLIAEVLANGDFVPAEEALRIDRLMREKHPRQHAAFLEAQSYRLYYEILQGAYQSQRQRSRHHAPASEFGRRATGKHDDVSVFITWRCKVDDANTQRTIGDMTGADHLYVADSYRGDKQRAAMLEAFHRAVAKKAGRRKTSEVFSEDQFLALYESIAK